MDLDENQLLSSKDKENFVTFEYQPIMEDIGKITTKYSKNIQCTFEGCRNEYKDTGDGCKLVTDDYLKNLNDFSVQAFKSLKNVRSYMNSVVNSTNHSVSNIAQNLKSVITKNSLLDNLMNTKKTSSKFDSEEEVKAPWVGTNNEEEAKELILSLSENRKTLLRKPPEGVFDFVLDEYLPIAKLLLKEDLRLQKLRFELVPKIVKEEQFWRNYFYRIRLIQQSFNINRSKLKFENTKPEGCLLRENSETKIYDCLGHNSNEQKNNMEIQKNLKEDSFDSILDSLHSIDTNNEIVDKDLDKEIEELLEEFEEN